MPESNPFSTKRLPEQPGVAAPDGSQVRVLLQLERGSMAHFELAAGHTSVAVAHRTIEEIRYFVGGRGEMWRRLGQQEDVVPVEAGVVITIPCGTHFQFRSKGPDPLAAIGVSMPPWPGEDEAYRVPGIWHPTGRPLCPEAVNPASRGSGTARRLVFRQSTGP